MKNEFSRRDLSIFGGASLLLAGCNQTDPEKSGVTARRGVPEPYGDHPHDKNPAPFNPAFVGVIDFRPAGGWKIAVNHAAFAVSTSATPEERLAIAVKAVKGKGNGGGTRLRNLTNGLRPVPGKGGELDFVDFDNQCHGFKSVNELFIYIDGKDVELNPKALISFTPFSGNLEKRNPNHSFYNAEIAQLPAGMAGKMIRVRNYMTAAGGKPIGVGHETVSQIYSMNFHFSVPSKEGGRIPIVIDPDTGNGSGNEP